MTAAYLLNLLITLCVIKLVECQGGGGSSGGGSSGGEFQIFFSIIIATTQHNLIAGSTVEQVQPKLSLAQF
jgi:hypothetical protein